VSERGSAAALGAGQRQPLVESPAPPGSARPAVERSHEAPGDREATATTRHRQLAEAPSRSRRIRLLLIPLLLVVGLVALTLGYRYWYESTYFVMTDNAQVTGDLIQVGSLNAGRVLQTPLEIGDTVRQGQEIAVVGVPQQVGTVAMGGIPVLQDTGATDARLSVRAPITGVVAARLASVGSTVSAGQPIYALVDTSQIWVRANVEEGKYAQLEPGQPVEVRADALQLSFPGRVEAVSPASAATFSLLPTQNTSGNFTKVTQLVPVKISVATGGRLLPLGTSVTVKIQVRQAAGGFPGVASPWLP
jgi:multidrug resistance efflux pump